MKYVLMILGSICLTTMGAQEIDVDVVTENNGSTASFRLFNPVDNGTLLMDNNEIDVVNRDMYLNFNSSKDIYLANGGGNVGVNSSGAFEARTQIKGNIVIDKGILYLENSGTTQVDEPALLIVSTPSIRNWGIGIRSQAGFIAIDADIPSTISTAGFTYAVSGINSTAAGTRHGVYGEVETYEATDAAYAVLGRASTQGTLSWAGYFDGDLGYTGSLISVSDARLKKNIKTVAGSLDRVLSLRPVSYEYRRDEYSNLGLAEGSQTGFLSQEVEEIFPELVEDCEHNFTTEKTQGKSPSNKITVKSMKYLELIPHLTRAIQEQQDMILDLQQEIIQLKQSHSKN